MEKRQTVGGAKVHRTVTKPHRVLVERNMIMETALAETEKGIKPSVIFRRSDGWYLGAPAELEQEAYKFHTSVFHWTHFAYSPFDNWMPIKQYGNGKKPS
jgi:hypothetical protein